MIEANLVSILEAATVRAGKTVTHFVPDRASLHATRERFFSVYGTRNGFKHLSNNYIETNGGGWIRFLVCEMSGSSCLHSSVLVIEGPGRSDEVAVREAHVVVARVDDFGPITIEF